jgi:hypothetical protein
VRIFFGFGEGFFWKWQGEQASFASDFEASAKESSEWEREKRELKREREREKLTSPPPPPRNHHHDQPLSSGEFAGLRARLGAEYREAVERRVFTVTGKRPTAADVDAMIESGESETVFQRAILEHGRGAVADTLADIRERHEAVRQLEGSLLDLHQVFLDMAVLVDAQGEMLDSIEVRLVF